MFGAHSLDMKKIKFFLLYQQHVDAQMKKKGRGRNVFLKKNVRCVVSE